MASIPAKSHMMAGLLDQAIKGNIGLTLAKTKASEKKVSRFQLKPYILALFAFGLSGKRLSLDPLTKANK